MPANCALLFLCLLLAPAPASACASTVASSDTSLHAAGAQDEERLQELITQGRALLAKKEYGPATVRFVEADSISGGELRTTMWILRVWMAQGRINDTLDEIDEWVHVRKAEGHVIDYLYGMTFYHKAKLYVSQSVPPRTTGLAFADAYTSLLKATTAAPEAYGDSFLPLAECAWHNGEYEVGLNAASKATKIAPKDPMPRYMAARLHVNRFYQKVGTEPEGDAATELYELSILALEQTLILIGETPAAGEQTEAVFLAGDVWLDLGYAHLVRGVLDRAGTALTEAIALNPAGVDYADLFGRMDATAYLALLDEASVKVLERWPANASADALLWWWLGYMAYSVQDAEKCERAYQLAVAKWPDYADSWYYIASSRYGRKDYAGAIEAWRTYWTLAPEGFVKTVEENVELGLAIFDYVVGWCEEQDRKADAQFICLLRTAIRPELWIYWNDLGYFSRDAGKKLTGGKAAGDNIEALALFKTSYGAYRLARTMAPTKPHLLNDGAVILQYFLVQDLDLAETMYRQAIVQATALIEGDELNGADLKEAQGAIDNARKNLKAMGKEE